MNKKLLSVVVGAIASMATVSSAMAADGFRGIQLSADVHGASSYNFRGQDFSDSKPTIGAGIVAQTHGAFAAANLNAVALPDRGGDFSSSSQYLADVTLGYSQNLGHGIVLGGGVATYQFFGPGDVEDQSFTELVAFGTWNGFQAKLAKNVDGADSKAPGLHKGDLYGEVGYTHSFGQFKLGADLGYTWYKESNAFPGVKDGLTVANLRAGYQVSPNFALGATLQAGGKDAYRNAWEGNNRLTVNAKYTF